MEKKRKREEVESGVGGGGRGEEKEREREEIGRGGGGRGGGGEGGRGGGSGGGGGGGGGRRGSGGMREAKEGRVRRKFIASTGWVHRLMGFNVVGAAGQWKRCDVVCRRKQHSGQRVDVDCLHRDL